MDKQKTWAGWVIIAVIVIIAATALAMGQLGTETESGVDTLLQQHESAFREIFPEADTGLNGFERLMLEGEADGLELAYVVRRGGATLGYVLKQTVQGYAGPIELTLGVREDRSLQGLRIGGAGFQETEGLGAKAKEPAFTDQFAGKTAPLSLGDGIDAIAGATVTSQAVVDGVNQAVERLNAILGDTAPSVPQPTADRSALTGKIANASMIGYAGPVLVRLTLDADGAVEAVDIGGVRFVETEGVGSRVREEAFTSQFTGKKPPFQLGENIDAAAGATVSSQAAVDAVNAAAAFLAE